MASPPTATPMPTTRSGPGCLLLVLLLPVVIVVGVVVGTVLNREDKPKGEHSVTIDEGTIGDTVWRVDAVRDVEGEICAFLFEDGVQLAGGCETAPEDASFGDSTVVFGKAAAEATKVRVELTSGETVIIDTVEADGIDGRFYVSVVDGDVDAVRVEAG